MTEARLEHVNVTVSNPLKTATRLCTLFGWHIRWQGTSKDGGKTVHVGSADDYVAVYAGETQGAETYDNYSTRGGLNHIGVVVNDLDAAEARVRAEGYTPHSHADYEPGRRFYFNDDDGIEFEVVSYEGTA
jgi:catechol 2,3-dioxygenase-like lactoylglutathione lyase family enzyme